MAVYIVWLSLAGSIFSAFCSLVGLDFRVMMLYLLNLKELCISNVYLVEIPATVMTCPCGSLLETQCLCYKV